MKIALGTAQFGLDYGVTNSGGQLSDDACLEILTFAEASGITKLDTAVAYGESEDKLGSFLLSQNFTVISKIPELSCADPLLIQQYVKSSLKKLKRKSLEAVLFHSEKNLLGGNADYYYEQLTLLKTKGLVNKVGVSFYTVEAAEIILSKYDIDLIQIPANILDRRFEKRGILRLAKSKGVEVHVRSIFLQGLLATNNRPEKFKNNEELQRFDAEADRLSLTSMQLALLYLTRISDIDYAVVGCLSAQQLKEIVESYIYCSSSKKELPDLSSNNLSLINPTNW